MFRVDNPHTKPFAFWEWLLATVKSEAPEAIFLSEAFTRPRVMEHLAKVGFSQSYTYFTWRSSKWELETYMNELTRSQVADYFRPNLWPNTPDILSEELQTGGRAAFVSRLVLAATLGAELRDLRPRLRAAGASGTHARAPRSTPARRSTRSDRGTPPSPDSLAAFMATGERDPARAPRPAAQRHPALPGH